MCVPAAVLLESSMFSLSLTQCAEGSGSETELCSVSEPLLCCRRHSPRGSGGASLAPFVAESSAAAAYHGAKRSSWPKCCRRKNESRLSEEFALSVLPLLHEGDGPADGVPPGTKADRRCCNENSRKVSLGLVMTLLIAASWVGAAHMLKATFAESNSPANQRLTREGRLNVTEVTFDAPFFTTWVCASFNTFFFPIFLMGRLCSRTEKTTAKNVLIETLAQLQEKQFTFSQFFSRCGLFCLLWVVTNYALVHSLRILDTTDVLALYASNVSFVYLLSWVILHEQFVGIRIVAVILCNTGIALLAYMDGVTRTMTLGGVVLSAAAAAGSGVYKVTFKKLIGDVSFGQLSLFFSLIGFLNLLLMWPVLLALYLLRFETIVWSRMPWGMLAGAGALSLLSNLLGNFGIIWTFEIFLTLGLAFAVPISAIVDVYIYEVMFEGMKLAGILLILIGFMLVLLPEDWPDYLTMILRYRRTSRRRRTVAKKPTPQDATTGHRSRLRTPSGRIK
ncbi:solute carrier family 35 member F3-like isoform X2 [Dermacentor andersoni]|uniref:solute carrier family 35 member F3-like isoform X2 n=1 Tax=Dermacentor andersoni TaxID=34620 RepID=UPI00215501B4|nr:putative thiamine transporter SLC35F3 isoform X2 [Dermacentor andersoni]